MIPTIPHLKIDRCPNGPSDDLDGIYFMGSKTLGTLIPKRSAILHSSKGGISASSFFRCDNLRVISDAGT